ncbi:MAG: TolC family protein [Proteobacteria bacterium]|nr:TolC family protein [Pseudomonadota bacterium]
MRRILLLCFILILFLFNKTTYGEQVLTLKDAITLSIKTNHYIKAKEFSLFAVKEEQEVAKSQFFPKLFLEEKFTKGNYNSYGVFTKLNQERLTMDKFFNPGEVNNFQTTIGLEMPIYVRELFINKSIKNKLYLIEENQFKRFQEDIAFEVFKSYLNVIKAKSMLQASEKALEDAKEIYRIAQVRVKNGIGIKSDELRAYVFMKERESDLIKTKNDILVSKRALGLILSLEEPIDAGDLNIDSLSVLPPLDDITKDVVNNRKDLIADMKNVETAKEGIETYKSKFYPKLYFSANYYNDDKSAPFGRDGSGYIAGVYLRWDIFDKARYDEIRKSRMEYERAKEYLNQREKEVRFRVYESYLRVQESKEKLEVAKETLKEAEETFRLIKLRYDNNLTTMVEVLDTEVALISARVNLVNSEMNYLESIGKALHEAGIFLKTVLNE